MLHVFMEVRKQTCLTFFPPVSGVLIKLREIQILASQWFHQSLNTTLIKGLQAHHVKAFTRISSRLGRATDLTVSEQHSVRQLQRGCAIKALCSLPLPSASSIRLMQAPIAAQRLPVSAGASLSTAAELRAYS